CSSRFISCCSSSTRTCPSSTRSSTASGCPWPPPARPSCCWCWCTWSTSSAPCSAALARSSPPRCPHLPLPGCTGHSCRWCRAAENLHTVEERAFGQSPSDFTRPFGVHPAHAPGGYQDPARRPCTRAPRKGPVPASWPAPGPCVSGGGNLGVVPTEVGYAAGWWVALQRGVAAVMIIGVEEGGELCEALGFAGVGARVGPF